VKMIFLGEPTAFGMISDFISQHQYFSFGFVIKRNCNK